MITLAVLAGGLGRRMGAPKDSLRDLGRPVLEVLLERVNWDGPTLLIAPHGGRLPAGHEAFHRVASDSVPDQGPLRGILTALLVAKTDEVVCVPVDMPGVGREHVQWVAEQLSARASRIGLLLTRMQHGVQRVEPFPSGFRVSASAMFSRRLEKGQLAVHHLADEPGVALASSPPEWGEQVWRNVNERSDLPEGWSLG